jgi:uncharacterized membrane protein YcaP (DUF421 family)
MIESLRQNADWISGAIYGSVMAATAADLSMLLINTALVTLTAFFVKKFAEWLYAKFNKKKKKKDGSDE